MMNISGLLNIPLLLDENSISKVNELAGKGLRVVTIIIFSATIMYYLCVFVPLAVRPSLIER